MKKLLKIAAVTVLLVGQNALALDQDKYCNKIVDHCTQHIQTVTGVQYNLLIDGPPTANGFEAVQSALDTYYAKCLADLQEEHCFGM